MNQTGSVFTVADEPNKMVFAPARKTLCRRRIAEWLSADCRVPRQIAVEYRIMTRFFYGCLVVLLLLQTAFAGQKTASLNLQVVKQVNGKPVRNAEVVLHLVDKDGHQQQAGLELKTHENGKAEANGIPYGKVRIQVIAHGFQTYGEDFDINQPNLEITIKLQKPAGQVSIYK